MMKKTLLFAAALCSCAVFAGEIYKAELGNLYPPKKIEEKDGVLRVAGKAFFIHSKTSFAVDPAKKYVISGEFRFLGTVPRSFNAGFMPLTKKNQSISAGNIDAVQPAIAVGLNVAIVPGEGRRCVRVAVDPAVLAEFPLKQHLPRPVKQRHDIAPAFCREESERQAEHLTIYLHADILYYAGA